MPTETLSLITVLLLLIAAGLTAAGIILLFRNDRKLIQLRVYQLKANSQLQKRRMDLIEVRNRARLLEDTVKHGTTAVEKMHQTIAGTAFSLIDHFAKDEEFRESARRAKDSHDKTSQQIYQAARTTNSALHLLADSLFISRRERKLMARKAPKNKQ